MYPDDHHAVKKETNRQNRRACVVRPLFHYHRGRQQYDHWDESDYMMTQSRHSRPADSYPFLVHNPAQTFTKPSHFLILPRLTNVRNWALVAIQTEKATSLDLRVLSGTVEA